MAFILAAVAMMARTGTPVAVLPTSLQALRCASFNSGRISAGHSFLKPIGGGLEFRLSSEPIHPTDRGRWWISIAPLHSRDDYVWLVSPPFQYAPHVIIGPAYDLNGVQSAQMSPRELHFVTSRAEYEDAQAFDKRADRGEPGITVGDIERKGRGTLTVWITGYGIARSGDSLTWIRVKVRACQPR